MRKHRGSASVRRRLIFAGGALAVALAAFLAVDLALPPVPRPALPNVAIGGPYRLVSSRGGTVTDQSFLGKWQLVYFGYTYCPDACPTALSEMAGALDELGPLADKVQPIFITVDPKRDTLQAMADYVNSFDSRIIGLTGTADEIEAAARAYHVYYAKVNENDAPDGYLVNHSSVIFVMRPDGRFVATFTHETSADQMAARLKQLIANYS